MHHRLRAVRKALKLIQSEFAKQIGLTQTALSMIEVGTNPITNKNIKLVCTAFNVNEQWLRTGEGEMFNASPYLKEFCDILVNLTPETQEYLLIMARKLLNVQKKLLDKV
ncbi:MAG: helix-turn-helix transcriptional regulator [Synergistaceae bacterium]|nr:helix-turn-helix transcriptional regulator [Synergistaceae bacterium]